MSTNGSVSRRQELQGLLMRALDVSPGLKLRVEGSAPNSRSLTIAALQAAKRELILEVPALLDLQIRALPYTKDAIALFKLDTHSDLEEE